MTGHPESCMGQAAVHTDGARKPLAVLPCRVVVVESAPKASDVLIKNSC